MVIKETGTDNSNWKPEAAKLLGALQEDIHLRLAASPCEVGTIIIPHFTDEEMEVREVNKRA